MHPWLPPLPSPGPLFYNNFPGDLPSVPSNKLESFYVPNASDLDEAHAFWDNIEKDFEECEALSRYLQKAMALIATRMDSLKNAQTQFDCLTAPIRRVPDDVWHEMFSWCAKIRFEEGAYEESESYGANFRLVSKRWNSVLLKTPEYWSHLIFDTDDFHSYGGFEPKLGLSLFMSACQQCIRWGSRASEIHIDWRLSRYISGRPSCDWGILVDEGDRSNYRVALLKKATTLHYTGNVPNARSWDKFIMQVMQKESFPRLRRLSLSAGFDAPLSLSPTAFPLLSDLLLRGRTRIDTQPLKDFPLLRTIRFLSVSWRDILRFLEACPQVTDTVILRAGLWHRDDWEFKAPVILPGIQRLTIENEEDGSMLKLMTCPKLLSLNLGL